MTLTRRGFLRNTSLTMCGFMSKLFFSTFSLPRSLKASSKTLSFAGKRWAMVVDMKKCKSDEECRDCIKACHQVHNVPDLGNEKDEIKWIWTVPYEKAFPEQEYSNAEEMIKNKPVVLLCNHCDEPPCVKVCPTRATWRREDGIVMMDYHRCIGCRYCMAGCPYGSRSFNWKDPRPFIEDINLDFPTRSKGVVEKCNFCVERLAQGLAPACVQACPEKALKFGDYNDPRSEIRRILQSQHIIQRQPELGTKPSVYYVI